ncbi:MAG: hypothetical protein ACLRSW_10350 [Christensenellaceae bacterium]
MNLYLSAGRFGLENYNFVVNRNPDTSAGSTASKVYGNGQRSKGRGVGKVFPFGQDDRLFVSPFRAGRDGGERDRD